MARLHSGVCPECSASDVLEGEPIELVDVNVPIPAALAYSQATGRMRPLFGLLRTYTCRACGLTQWHALQMDQVPSRPALRPRSDDARCEVCRSEELIDIAQAEVTNQVAVFAAAVTYKTGIGGHKPTRPFGRLRTEACRDCGHVRWHAVEPDEIPVGERYDIRPVPVQEMDAPKGGAHPFRSAPARRATMREGHCPRCAATKVIEAPGLELISGPQSTRMAVTYQWKGWSFDFDEPLGALLQYVCQACGHCTHYADSPQEIPIDEVHGTRLVREPDIEDDPGAGRTDGESL